MNDGIQYERTEYARITPPIAERFDRISRERGFVVVPLDSSGRDADGNVPGNIGPDTDAGTASDPAGDASDREPARENDRGALDGVGLGFLGRRGRPASE